MKPKLTIVTNFLIHYRLPLYKKLASHFELTVIHSSNLSELDLPFKQISLPIKKVGPFFFQKGLFRNLKIDQSVVLMFDVRYLNSFVFWLYFKLINRNKENKIVLWGAWLTSSKIANYVRYILMKNSPKSILYTSGSRNEFISMGLKPNSLVVANNTYHVESRYKCYTSEQKDLIISVGGLNSRKGFFEMIMAFYLSLASLPQHISLCIIGSGPELENINRLRKKLGIESRVIVLEAINDETILADYYRRAIFSVSYSQAGLSILQSFAYGVPYVTMRGAISGGEIENIRSEFNGILCNPNVPSLSSVFVHLCNDINYATELGRNAYEYYSQYCTIANMAYGFVDALLDTNYTRVDS